ncbi:DUF11 domain-containing protein, partial [Tropicimonas aquimaris]
MTVYNSIADIIASGIFSVTTDKDDYAPGSTATLTAWNVEEGGTVAFRVQHLDGANSDGSYILDAGVDGVYGTADDGYGPNPNGYESDHDPFYVTDGVWWIEDAGIDGIEDTDDDVIGGDLDKTVNGTIEANWYVREPDSLNELFLVTAKEIDLGADGAVGGGDDSLVGTEALATFTDAGGAYSLNFAAADPSIYIPSIPFPGLPGTDYITGGRGDGSALIPLADFNNGTSDVRVESLAPEDMALGQIVPFETKISVSGDTAPEDGVITFVIGWNTLTTNGGDFGYDARADDIGYGVIEAFIDTSDGAHFDPGGDAKVDSFTWSLINNEIVGIFTVSGLDSGDVVVLEPWLVLDDTIPAGIGGNVQSRLIDAATGSDQTINVANSGTIELVNGDSISTGNQTVPLLKPSDFFTADVDVSVVKTDSDGGTPITAGNDPDPTGDTLILRGEFTYTVKVSNAGPAVANTVVVTDTLDPNVTFVSATGGGVHSGGVVTWDIGALAPDEEQFFTVTVDINDGFVGGTLSNLVEVSTISDDINPANDSNIEETLVPAAIAAIDVTKTVTDVGGDGSMGVADLAGEIITYQISVDNTGDLPMTKSSVTDQVEAYAPTDAVYVSGDNSNIGVLDPDEIWIYSATYELTQADIDGNGDGNGRIDNLAQATFLDPFDNPVNDSDFAYVPVAQNASLELLKDGSYEDVGSDGLNVGDKLNYTFKVTNTGNVTVTGVTITEDSFDLPGPIAITPPADTDLDPTES